MHPASRERECTSESVPQPTASVIGQLCFARANRNLRPSLFLEQQFHGEGMSKSALVLAALVLFCLILCSCGGGSAVSNVTSPPVPTPSSQVPRSPVNHLLVVTMQNASFDHLFGT